MDFTFTTDEAKGIQVRYIEDARSDLAPFWRARVTLNEAKAQVTRELSKLGAYVLTFQEGYFGNRPKRYGYQILFQYQGAQGRIRVAGLPMRSETKGKIQQVRIQALLNVRDWLKVTVTQQVFNPNSEPLMQYLLVDGRRTLAEYIRETGRLALPEPGVIDGEFEEG